MNHKNHLNHSSDKWCDFFELEDLDEEAIEVWNPTPRDKLNEQLNLPQPIVTNEGNQRPENADAEEDDEGNVFHPAHEHLDDDDQQVAVDNGPPPVPEAPAVDGRTLRKRGMASYKETRAYQKKQQK